MCVCVLLQSMELRPPATLYLGQVNRADNKTDVASFLFRNLVLSNILYIIYSEISKDTLYKGHCFYLENRGKFYVSLTLEIILCVGQIGILVFLVQRFHQ